MNLGKKGKKKTWWLPNYYFNPPAKKAGEVNNSSYGRFSVMICPECNYAWEIGLIGKKRCAVYYDDFPSYKLEKVQCPNCEDKHETD